MVDTVLFQMFQCRDHGNASEPWLILCIRSHDNEPLHHFRKPGASDNSPFSPLKAVRNKAVPMPTSTVTHLGGRFSVIMTRNA
ncbi:MAG: hypothetical protein J5828_00445 [Desulfovibrionaceae bacterium]|nr:hypothetical protein [Desulfovibrionaceae bacterium]